MQTSGDYWLSLWSQAAVAPAEVPGISDEPPQLPQRAGPGEAAVGGGAAAGGDSVEVDTAYYLGVYAVLSLGTSLAIMARTALVNAGVLRAAQRLHARMLRAVLRAPVRFFDTTPVGRVLNRFAGDQVASLSPPRPFSLTPPPHPLSSALPRANSPARISHVD